jgi:hypothetical protein
MNCPRKKIETPKTMTDMIETMPTYLGEQFYISGFPLPAKDVHYQGVSIQDRFIREFDSESVLVDEETTPPTHKTVWILWYCEACDDFEYEFF